MDAPPLAAANASGWRPNAPILTRVAALTPAAVRRLGVRTQSACGRAPARLPSITAGATLQYWDIMSPRVVMRFLASSWTGTASRTRGFGFPPGPISRSSRLPDHARRGGSSFDPEIALAPPRQRSRPVRELDHALEPRQALGRCRSQAEDQLLTPVFFPAGGRWVAFAPFGFRFSHDHPSAA